MGSGLSEGAAKNSVLDGTPWARGARPRLRACEEAARTNNEVVKPSNHDHLDMCDFHGRSRGGKGFIMSPEHSCRCKCAQISVKSKRERKRPPRARAHRAALRPGNAKCSERLAELRAWLIRSLGPSVRAVFAKFFNSCDQFGPAERRASFAGTSPR